jgi:NAD+ kinase
VSTFLFVPHRMKPEAADLARRLADWLASNGHLAVMLADDAREIGLTKIEIAELDDLDLDCAVSLGGDGTMLRALDLVCAKGTPVMGINFGQLAYLAEVEPDQAMTAISRFLDGEHRVEERMTIEIGVTSGSDHDATNTRLSLARRIAVNEVVVEKLPLGTTVRLGIEVNGRPFLTYAVDGMIVATPTGSTAYNLSARGPILSPSIEAMLMTPVSAHMLFDRSMVLAPDEELSIRVLGERDAAVVVDGQNVATISAGGVVTCKRAGLPARLVTFSERDFRQVLKSKFGLADR